MAWKFKLGLKILLGRFPVLKAVFKRLGYFRHGRMGSLDYATGVFTRHVDAYRGGSKATMQGDLPFPKGGTCLEIGPGESLLTLLLARAAGFDRVILLDDGHQIQEDLRPYLELSRRLREQGHPLPVIQPDWGMADILQAYHGQYLTAGLSSLASLPDASIDFSFSHAVFEHLPRPEVPQWLRELRRVARIPAISSHVVDLRDHLGGSIHHLRFTPSFWESAPLRRSGIYTNRLRFSQWMRLFQEAGWKAHILERQTFPSLPVDRKKLDPTFRALDDSDLLTHGFQVTLGGA